MLAVCRSVFLTTCHCILSGELTKTLSFRLYFWRFCLLGTSWNFFSPTEFHEKIYFLCLLYLDLVVGEVLTNIFFCFVILKFQ